jgi:hypothetical protein
MSREELVCVPAPVLGPVKPVKAGPPFVVTETLTVHEAAMMYRDRHPGSGFLRDLNIYDPTHIAKLEDWIGRRDLPTAKLLGDLRTQPEEEGDKRLDEWLNMYFGGDEARRSRDKRDAEQNWRVSWEVASELSAAIASGAITPIHTERDPHGRPIPLVCTIRLADLLAIARRRGDAGDIVSSLATWYEPADSEPQTGPAAGTLPRGTVKDDTVRAWYEAHIKERTNRKEQTSEAADWAAAQVEFGDRVSRDQVRRLRPKLVPAAWRKKGRHPKAAEKTAE